MSSTVEVTLGDLARIALGAPSFDLHNRAVFHGLVVTLLKKLDCHNEKLQIGASDSNCLKKMLENSTINPFAFQEDHLEIIQEKFKRLSKLEESVDTIQDNIRNYIEIIGENQQWGLYDHHNWEHYAGICEDLCVIPEPENAFACQIIRSPAFINGMLRRTSFPLIDRMFEFEKRAENLHTEFQKFMKDVDDHFLEMAYVELCIPEIEHVRNEVKIAHSNFLDTIDQMKDMFIIKLDKIHLGAMKKYLHKRFDDIELELKSMNRPHRKSKVKSMPIDNRKCLSCGNEIPNAAGRPIPFKSRMPEALTRNEPKILKNYSSCPAQSQAATQQQTEQQQQLQVTPIKVGIVNIELTSAHFRSSTKSNECALKGKPINKRRMALIQTCKDPEETVSKQQQMTPVSNIGMVNPKPSALSRSSEGHKKKRESTFSLSFER